MKLLNNSQIVSTSANSKRKPWLLTGIIILLSLLLALPATAQDKKKSTRKTKQTVAMSQPVYEKLMEIQEFVEAEDFPNAQAAIVKLQSKKKLSPYESAQIWNLSGYSFYLQEDYKAAISSYKKVLAQADLPEALQQSTLKTLAQLHFTVEDYELALETIKRLMQVVAEPAADVYMLLGQAYFQMKNYEDAIPPIQTANRMYRDQ